MTLSIFASVLAACGGGSGLLGGDVVGQWRELPNATDDAPPPVAERELFEFAADGTFVERAGEQGDPSTGTFTTDGGQLTITEDDTGDTSSLPYLATSDRFVFGALVPDGTVDGFVGTWTAVTHSQDGDGMTTLVLDADATAHSESVFGTEVQAFDGTWRSVGDDLELDLDGDSITLTLRATLIDGVLGTAYERL